MLGRGSEVRNLIHATQFCCGREACGGPQFDDDYGGSRLLLILNLTWVMDFSIRRINKLEKDFEL